MVHFSAPAHPLVHAFLLARTDFQDKRYIIVETADQAEKLLKNIQGLKEIFPSQFPHEYRLILSELDALELAHDENIVGIYSLPLPKYFSITPASEGLILELAIGMPISEEKCINWLIDHGYEAMKSDEVGTYFRVGDTLSVMTKKGLLQVSFFGSLVEDMFFGGEKVNHFSVFALK